jgi:single-strand DNA-binding protein
MDCISGHIQTEEEGMMNNLNSILLEGNLVADPELRYTPNGAAVCSFRVASNRFFKQEEELQKEVSYFDVTTWNRQAEVCNEYLSKGRGVRVVGRLKQDRWQDAEGKTRSKVHIVAEHVEFKPKFKNDETTVAEGEEQTKTSDASDDLADPEDTVDFPEQAVEAAS